MHFLVDRFVRVRLTLFLLQLPCAFLFTVHRHSFDLALPKGANVAIEGLVIQNYDEVYLPYIVINNVLKVVSSWASSRMCVGLPSDACEFWLHNIVDHKRVQPLTRSVLRVCKFQ